MAKVNFNKLGLKPNNEVVEIELHGNVVEVKQYLPIEDKLDLITNIINYSVDENNYYNPCRIDVYKTIFMIEAYTNITFTDKQKENIFKLYDLIVGNELFNEVCMKIPALDLNWINKSVQESIESIYTYKNSVLGILDAVKNNYQNINLDVENMMGKITDPEALSTLKELVNISGLTTTE